MTPRTVLKPATIVPTTTPVAATLKAKLPPQVSEIELTMSRNLTPNWRTGVNTLPIAAPAVTVKFSSEDSHWLITPASVLSLSSFIWLTAPMFLL